MKIAMLVVAFICSFIAAANAEVWIFKGKMDAKPEMACFLKMEKENGNVHFEPYASRFKLTNYNIAQSEMVGDLLRNDMQLYLTDGNQGLNLSFTPRMMPQEYSVLSADEELLFICSNLVKI